MLGFDNNFTANKINNCFYNTDIVKKNLYLLYYIDCYESKGHKFYNINQMTIDIISDRCNMTYKRYINQTMSMCKRKINKSFARNPHLINSLDHKKSIL